MAVHAIGDRANHEVLNAYTQLREYERAQGLPAQRHRIEHVQVLHSNDLTRLAELDVIASVQPIHATADMYAADDFWGESAVLAYAFKSLLDSGTRLAFGSDAPVESPNPFWGLQAAVARRRNDGSPGPEGWRPEQKLDLLTALRGFTRGPAYTGRMEDRLGMLARGYLADLILLDADPFATPPEQLHTIQPLATMVGGDWVWRR
jgi:predicted amidohydrolase YtcJ